jgi:hypothetical protein
MFGKEGEVRISYMARIIRCEECEGWVIRPSGKSHMDEIHVSGNYAEALDELHSSCE